MPMLTTSAMTAPIAKALRSRDGLLRAVPNMAVMRSDTLARSGRTRSTAHSYVSVRMANRALLDERSATRNEPARNRLGRQALEDPVHVGGVEARDVVRRRHRLRVEEIRQLVVP